MKQWKYLVVVLVASAIVETEIALLLIRDGFKATSEPSTFEKTLARTVRNFAIPRHDRTEKNFVDTRLGDFEGSKRTFHGTLLDLPRY